MLFQFPRESLSDNGGSADRIYRVNHIDLTFLY